MTQVAVTGAGGTIGRETIKALSNNGHEVLALTHREHDDITSRVIEIEDLDDLVEAFAESEIVIHMAAIGSARAEWERVNRVNIDGTYQVFEAARQTNVQRVVFGSSNHVTHMYNMPNPTNPEETEEDPCQVSPRDRFRPSSYYGISKLAGEGLGSLYADRFGLEVVNLRIGYFQEIETLRENQSKEPNRARQARAMFLSPRDYRQAINQAIETKLEKNPLTVNLISRNDDRYHTLIEAIRGLGYRPRDNSAEILSG